MRRALLLAALALIAPPVAVLAGERDSRTPLIAVDPGDGAEHLQRVDPLTLRPTSRPIPGLREAFTGAASPDERRFALGSAFGRHAAIRVIDLAGWRSERLVELRRRGPVTVSWPARDRIVAVAGSPLGGQEILVVDPFGARIIARHSFSGRFLWHAPVAAGLVVLLARQRGLGPARLLYGDASGAVEEVLLERIEAGGNEGARRVRYRQPGLAVDPEGGRAYVVAAADRTLVADVELASGAVGYHRIAEPPAARAAKGNMDVWWREASWVGNGTIAVTGYGSRPPRGDRLLIEPHGLRLIDTGSWTSRTLAERPMEAHLAGDLVLASGTSWSPRRRDRWSTGLLAFDRDGDRAFARFRGRDVVFAGSHGRLGYIWVQATHTLHVLDLRDGRTLRRIHAWPRDLPLLISP
jgi:hypothetical protein